MSRVAAGNHTGAPFVPVAERSRRVDSPLGIALRRFSQHAVAVAGVVMLAILVAVAAAAPLLAPFDPLETGLGLARSGPNETHLLGLDSVGRDLLSRLIYGARASLIVGTGAVAIQVVIGTIVGGISGYAGGWLDTVLMRATDVILSFPLFVVVVAAVAITGPSLVNVVLVVGLLGWPPVARLVRSQALSLRAYPFVEAARSLGAPGVRVLAIHVLPNTLPPIVVAATFGVARAILLEAALSFLGLGVQPPTPSWGNLLAEAQSLTVLESMPWVWLPPGLCLMALVLAVNFIGDGLRDALDPKTVLRTSQ